MPPKWPDFEVRRVDDNLFGGTNGQVLLHGATDTGRPKTPVFGLYLTASEDTIARLGGDRAAMEQELQLRFKAAHPCGCPGRKD